MSYEYLMAVKIDENYPTAKEIATKISKKYGIVTVSGRIPVSFVRSFLDAKMKVTGLTRLMTATEKVFVYQNYKDIFIFLDEVFEKLKNAKAMVFDLFTADGMESHKLLYKPAVTFYRKRPVGIPYDTMPRYSCTILPAHMEV